jgi:hypothetical protein
MGKFLSASVPACQTPKVGKFSVLSVATHGEVCIGLVLLFGNLAPHARADSIYEYKYTGNPMIGCPTPCALSAELYFSAPLPPDYNEPATDTEFSPYSYTITDGTRTLTNTDSGIEFFLGSTDSYGVPMTWSLTVGAPNDGYVLASYKQAFREIFAGIPTTDASLSLNGVGYFASNVNDPGTWVAESNVPKPSSLLLLGIGLLGLGTVSKMVGRKGQKPSVA